MKNIRMVDLHGQYLHHREEINKAIQNVLNSTEFIKGEEVRLFEKELAAYVDAKHCISCANGTDALQVSMMALDLHPGDAVITTPFTFIATIEVISLLKLKTILVDVDPETFNLDPKKLEAAITPATKAIVPVHLFGQAADMTAILDIAYKYNLFIIEDNAQAIGANYRFSNALTKKTGTMGHIGCTSFFPSKNLGAYGDGGALFTNDPGYANRLKSIVNHGMSERYFYEQVGVNSRLDTIQAAILRVKLKNLDSYIKARQDVAAAYDKSLSSIPDIVIPARNPDSDHVYHQYTIKVKKGKRDSLKSYLNENNIPAMIYYPYPLHLQNAYKDLMYRKGDFPVSEELCTQVLSLPIHTEMEKPQLDHIISTIIQFFNQ